MRDRSARLNAVLADLSEASGRLAREGPSPTRCLCAHGREVALRVDEPGLQVTAFFPRLPVEQSAANATNRAIAYEFGLRVTAARRAYAEHLAARGGAPPQPPWMLYLGYTAMHTHTRLYAVDAGGYQYTGGAHGTEVHLPLVIERRSGKALTPTSLFRPDSNWAELLSTAARRVLLSRLPFRDNPDLREWLHTGTEPRPDNFALLLPESDGLRLTFPAYQIAPPVHGPFEVRLPYTALHAALNPELFVV